MSAKPIETEATDWPVCPTCGHEHRDAWEWGLAEDDTDTVECNSCGARFHVVLHVWRSFDTSVALVDDPEV